MQTPYTAKIKEMAPGFDPRHVEAYMRSEHPTLDALSPRHFRSEVGIAVCCIVEGGLDMAERVAKSFGL